jgi:hypothetical protein
MLPVEIIRKFVSHVWETGKSGTKRDKPKEKPNLLLIIANDYQKNNLGLGDYLEDIYKLKDKSRGFYGTKSGTLQRKDELPDFCIKNFANYKLDPKQDKTIIELYKKIFAHIAECNGDKLE